MGGANGKYGFSEGVLYRYVCCRLWAKSLELSLVMKNQTVLPSREGEDREFFLCLFLLNWLRLKIILTPGLHILGWNTLNPSFSHLKHKFHILKVELSAVQRDLG